MPETKDTAKRNANRLAKESSPYLLQHAHNPVDWYPWGEEAFAKARDERKLMLVSVGYSSCHWCHVMERECFEDEAIAKLMNQHFVCIKVDREERPDVDQVYMTAVQLMTQRGGWPLNCFTLPDGRPIYGGTYFPPAQWSKVLTELDATWQNDPERVMEYATRLTKGIASSALVEPASPDADVSREQLADMLSHWEPLFDRTHGGPDKAPKFPLPNNYEFLLRYAFLTNDSELKQHVELTLDKMALGGIFDQVGGGFARYSTDVLWKVPHFEKMLYDNAQLVSLYSQAYQAFAKPLYKRTVEHTVEFLFREMTGPDGAFYSALDADTEGEEGKYYVWTKDELMAALGPDYDLCAAYYNVNDRGHWEHGNHILLRHADNAQFAAEFGISEAELETRMAGINTRLLEARNRRQRPGLDDKSLTSWNAMLVKGLCDAYEVFGKAEWLAAAERNMELLLSTCRRSNGGLWHNLKNGKASINGYLEDYCFSIEALLALYGITFNERWLNEATALAEHAIRHFHDEESGLFHFTSDLDPPLITRPREVHDNVVPASNSSMAKALHLLGTLLDEEHYLAISRHMMVAMADKMADYPSGHSNWAQLALMLTFPCPEIAITGPEALLLRAEFAKHYHPNRLFLGSTTRSDLPLLKDKFLPASTIFVCVDKACQLPVPTVGEALKQLP
jgi:uncharacterized protein YyaL (SSP411 family)